MPDSVVCHLSSESAYWRPDPFPGSPFAQERGCRCPEAQPWPGALEFAVDCPLHVIEMATDA